MARIPSGAATRCRISGTDVTGSTDRHVTNVGFTAPPSGRSARLSRLNSEDPAATAHDPSRPSRPESDPRPVDTTPADRPIDPGPEAPPRSDPGSRATGPPSRLARNTVVGILIAFVVASNVANAFLSVLVTDHPLLFMGLNAQNRNLALASSEVSTWSFYVVGFLRLIGPDPFFFLLGRWYGDGAIRWVERKAPTYGELIRHLERWFERARLPVVAIAPNNYVCLFAGASDMAWTPFLVANVIGTIGRLWLVRMFSGVFEGPLGSIRGFIGEYRWPLLALTLALVAFSIVSERRAGRDAVLDLAAMDDNIEQHERRRADRSDPTRDR